LLCPRSVAAMTGKAGALSTKPTELPARYERLLAWQLDRRCKAVREVAGDLVELRQDLGGAPELSAQKRWLAERVVFLRRRMLAYGRILELCQRLPGSPADAWARAQGA
jgi:hypothetical protein